MPYEHLLVEASLVGLEAATEDLRDGARVSVAKRKREFRGR
jgi:hypothetical protein